MSSNRVQHLLLDMTTLSQRTVDVHVGRLLPTYGATNVVPTRKEQPHLIEEKNPSSKHVNGLGRNENMVMG
jgi:stress response protein YsnF